MFTKKNLYLTQIVVFKALARQIQTVPAVPLTAVQRTIVMEVFLFQVLSVWYSLSLLLFVGSKQLWPTEKNNIHIDQWKSNRKLFLFVLIRV
jgi:hypothetical protein